MNDPKAPPCKVCEAQCNTACFLGLKPRWTPLAFSVCSHECLQILERMAKSFGRPEAIPVHPLTGGR